MAKKTKQENTTAKKGGKKRSRLTDVLLVMGFLVGLGVFLYPSISQFINDITAGRAVANYQEGISRLKEDETEELWHTAEDYNELLASDGIGFKLNDDEMMRYNALLNPVGTGMMGHVEIPKLGCDLPIYHGVDASVLQIGIGHIPGTSLPVGGPSTHCVVSGHRGLPTSRLFTDLDKMEEGDLFILHVLNRDLAYQVDQIRIVLPAEVEQLRIVDGEDLCTLVTCTPYAINTHRLLVRGHRVDYLGEEFVPADAVILDPTLVASAIAIPVFVILLIVVFVRTSRRRSADLQVKGMIFHSRAAARTAEKLLGLPPGSARVANLKQRREDRLAAKQARRDRAKKGDADRDDSE